MYHLSSRDPVTGADIAIIEAPIRTGFGVRTRGLKVSGMWCYQPQSRRQILELEYGSLPILTVMLVDGQAPRIERTAAVLGDKGFASVLPSSSKTRFRVSRSRTRGQLSPERFIAPLISMTFV